MVATGENTLHPMYLDSQKGNRSRGVTRRLQYPTEDLNSKWKKEVLGPPRSEMEVNIWEIKPPDFIYKLYTSLGFPEKPSRSIKEEQGRGKRGNFQETRLHMPSIRSHPKKAKSSEFITTFPHLNSHKAKLIFVKSGKYPNGVYLNPKPHDFQQYQPNLPNFVTTYERDPLGLKFKSRHLSTVHECPSLKDDKQNSSERFITYKPQECTWDSKLILPKAPWPIKSASFTRHRRRRDVYSAFMDRVEDKFTQMCKNR
uniref:Chromosome 7 open reading frame 78 n=1 Tax=Neovison vison TaxID=452646 RepID=A0A8C7B7X8_NEOVI